MKRILATAVVMTMMLAACSAEDGVSETFREIGNALEGDGQSFDGDAAPAETIADSLSDLPGSKVNLDIAFTADRKVIRQVSLTLASDQTRATYDEIVRIAEAAGGFVSDAQVNPSSDDEEPYIIVTVRIPATGLSSSLDAIKDAADEVLAESQEAQDVTASFIDLEAQMTNLQALEVELRALLEEVRQQPDADPDKLLRVFTEISNTRGQIEQIQGQLNYLTDVVDLSTVTVSIEPTAASLPIVEESWAPVESVRNALRDLVAGLQDITDGAINFTIGLLPILMIVVGIPGLGLFLVYRAWRRRHPAGAAAPLLPTTE